MQTAVLAELEAISGGWRAMAFGILEDVKKVGASGAWVYSRGVVDGEF